MHKKNLHVGRESSGLLATSVECRKSYKTTPVVVIRPKIIRNSIYFHEVFPNEDRSMSRTLMSSIFWRIEYVHAYDLFYSIISFLLCYWSVVLDILVPLLLKISENVSKNFAFLFYFFFETHLFLYLSRLLGGYFVLTEGSLLLPRSA